MKCLGPNLWKIGSNWKKMKLFWISCYLYKFLQSWILNSEKSWNAVEADILHLASSLLLSITLANIISHTSLKKMQQACYHVMVSWLCMIRHLPHCWFVLPHQFPHFSASLCCCDSSKMFTTLSQHNSWYNTTAVWSATVVNMLHC